MAKRKEKPMVDVISLENVFRNAITQVSNSSSSYIRVDRYKAVSLIEEYNRYINDYYMEIYTNGLVISLLDGRTNKPIDDVMNDIVLSVLPTQTRAYHLFLELKNRLGDNKYLKFEYIDIELDVIYELREIIKDEYSLIMGYYERETLDNGFCKCYTYLVRNCDLIEIASKLKKEQI